MNLYKLHTDPEYLLYGDTPNRDARIIAVDIANSPTADDPEIEGTIVAKIIAADLGHDKTIEKAMLKLKKRGVYLMDLYADEVIGERFRKAEKYIMKDKYLWDDYRHLHGMYK